MITVIKYGFNQRVVREPELFESQLTIEIYCLIDEQTVLKMKCRTRAAAASLREIGGFNM